MLGVNLAIPNAARTRVGGGGSSKVIALNARFVAVGDSIGAIANMRSPLHWAMYYLNGRGYTPPGSRVNCVGGACVTLARSTAAGNADNRPGTRLDFLYNQITPKVGGKYTTVVLWQIATNEISATDTSLAAIQAEMQPWFDQVEALGGLNALITPLKSGSNQVNDGRKALYDSWDAWYASKANTDGYIYCPTAAVNFDPNTMSVGDALHPNCVGGDVAGKGIADDIGPFFEPGTILYGASAPSDNIETNWDFTGNAGTKSTGTADHGTIGGTDLAGVATGFSAFLSSNGQAGGSTIGVTAACKTIDLVIPGVTGSGPGGAVRAQLIDINGSSSATGVLVLNNSVSYSALTPNRTEAGDFNEAFSYVAASAVDGVSAPVGITSIGSVFGTGGGFMSRNVDATAGQPNRAFKGVMRTTPIAILANAGTLTWEVAFGVVNGPINLRVIVAQLGTRRVELTEYDEAFNLQGAMTGVTNPLNVRPNMTGTPGVGNTLTFQPAMVNGGGMDHIWRLKRNGSTILTKVPGDTPMTYVQQAGDSGTALTLEQESWNSIGSHMIATSSAVNVP